MEESQPDHEQCIINFRRYLEKQEVTGINGFSAKVECPFIPVSALKEYLTGSRIRAILKVLSANQSLDQTICNQYLIVFSILLRIGKARYIEHFTRFRSLSDRFLPFTTLDHSPDNWPGSSADFFPAFYDEQWRFCALTFDRDQSPEICLDKRQILPIVEKVKLNSGGSANVYKIKLHAAYNDLVDKASWESIAHLPIRNY
jgi:hypothetical protein